MAISSSLVPGTNFFEFLETPIETVEFFGHRVYVKRDDLPSILPSPTSDSGLVTQKLATAFSGNKARKLYHYLNSDFPDISGIFSYGSAQSNMLFSLSELAKLRNWRFDFYVDHIPSNLADNPRGNYGAALANGARIHQVGRQCDDIGVAQYVQQIANSGYSDLLYIPEGGSGSEAEMGIKILAAEIDSWVTQQQIENPKLFLPSGTGTTAFFLQKHLPFEVLTCPCVGDQTYLKSLFTGLLNIESNVEVDTKRTLPIILPPLVDDTGAIRKYHFGRLDPELLDMWRQLRQDISITFDLLYDPLGWLYALEYLRGTGSRKGGSEKENQPVPNLIYLHQGGVLGNQTMLERYYRKWPYLAPGQESRQD